MLLRFVAILSVLTGSISIGSAAKSPGQSIENRVGKVMPVPGQCTEPAALNVGKPGCFLTTTLAILSAPSSLYWHIYSIEDVDKPQPVLGNNSWAVVSHAHGKLWRYILGPRDIGPQPGKRLAIIGPLRLTGDAPVTARFIESTFLPGMRTRVHSHPGPEAFFVLDGMQCMDSPTKRQRVRSGGTFIVPSKLVHVQTAPQGRRNIAVVLYQPGSEWMTIETAWRPTDYCGLR